MVIGLVVAPLFMTSLAVPLPFGLGNFLPPLGQYGSSFLNSFIGLLLGGAPLYLIGLLWEKLRKVEAMGGGDVKYMAMIGSFLGWKGAFLTIMIGALTGSIVGVALILLKRQQADKVIPFGPFLAFGTVLTMFMGSEIIAWYLDFLRI
jgi:leader peptidase (prepilin peptidase)/N-methyltransferase